MVKKILPFIQDNSKIIDPAAGDGAFVKELIRQGVRPSQIHANDINDKAIEQLRNLIPNVHERDSIKDFGGKFRAIIGNPPYGSNENPYIRENREYLRNRFEPILPTNLYVFFIVQAIDHLEEGGVLCFLVLDYFLSTVWYRKLRELILNTCKIREILLCPPDLFRSRSADVRTCIITLEKASGPRNATRRHRSLMRLVERIQSEAEYSHPKWVQTVPQSLFDSMPEKIFFVNVPKSFLDGVIHSRQKLGDVVRGGTGISTGNDRLFVRKGSEYKNKAGWAGYFKGAGDKPYYYETDWFLEKKWNEYGDIYPNYLVRNKQFFLREGITTSCVGIRFSASYLPSGNVFGMNTNLFFDTDDDLFYFLGFLNSSFVEYALRAVINRTNNVSSGTIKKLPYVAPNEEAKIEVAETARFLVKSVRDNPLFDLAPHQERINKIVFDTYKIPSKDRIWIDYFCSNIMQLV